MDHRTMVIGAAFVLLNVAATVILGTEFVFQEIRALVTHRRDRQPDDLAALSSGTKH